VAVIGGNGGPSYSGTTRVWSALQCPPRGNSSSGPTPSAYLLAGAAVPFCPIQLFLPGQSGVWYDFSDLTTLFQSGTRASPGAAVAADGDPVGLVLDKSGNNRDLVQATSTKRPLYKTSAGVSWLLFDGVDDFLQSSAAFNLSAYGQISAALAFTPLSTAVQVVCELGPNVSSATAGTFYLAAVNDPATGQIDCAINSVGSAQDAVATTSTSYGNGITSTISFQSIDITNASAAARLPMRRNGAAEPVTTTTDADGAGTVFSGTQTLFVGMRNGASLPFSGKLYGLFIRGQGLAASEISSLDTWITAKTVAPAAYSLVAATGTFSLSGQAATPAVAIPASTAAFVLTGNASTLASTIPASTASFSLTGNAVSLPVAVTAATGTFVLSGVAASLAAKIPASTAVFALTGNAAVLRHGYPLAAATGGFVVTGRAAALVAAHILTAAPGSFIVTGQSVALRSARLLAAATGPFTITGTTTLLAATMPAGAAAFALNGSAVTLRAAVPAALGIFTLTGNAAGLNKTGSSTLTAGAGAFTLSGRSASPLRGALLAAAPASFVVSGVDAALKGARRFTASPGAFTITTPAAGVLHQASIAASSGTFTIATAAGQFRRQASLQAGSATFVVSGLAARIVSIVLPTPASRSVAGVRVDRTAAGTAQPRSVSGSAPDRTVTGELEDRGAVGNLQPRRSAA
jgi:hypothetical protein